MSFLAASPCGPWKSLLSQAPALLQVVSAWWLEGVQSISSDEGKLLLLLAPKAWPRWISLFSNHGRLLSTPRIPDLSSPTVLFHHYHSPAGYHLLGVFF